MTDLIEFLENAHRNLRAIGNWEKVHFVIGNESCAMDSMVCTLGLAFYYSVTPTRFVNDVVIPVINLNSNLFRIKTENLYVLNKFQIPTTYLIFRNYINFDAIPKNATIQVTLVDLHMLSKEMKFLEPYVVCIYDHRPIEKAANFGDCDIHIRPVGSCATLVATKVFCGRITCICTVAMLLYSAIIFDTVGFKAEAKKAKELDVLVAENIEQALRLQISRKDYFEELWSAHNDISGLTTEDILRKDLKTHEMIGIPGLPMLVETFLERPDAEAALYSLCTDKKIELVVLMGLETQDKVKRDIAFYFPVEIILVHLVRQHLVTIHRDIGLRLDPAHETLHMMYYRQNNTDYSRKKIIPILQYCVELYNKIIDANMDKRGKGDKKSHKSKSS